MAQPTDLGKYNNQRYHCKFCNTYCLNNASQVDKHNNGNRHRRAVENYLKQNRKAKQRESAQERKLEKELSSIARAANAAMGSAPGGAKITGFVPAVGKEDHAAWKKRRAAKDAQDADKYTQSNYSKDSDTPYGPSGGASGGADDGNYDDDDDDIVGGDVAPEIPGHYAIGDDWFLEGTLYEHLLAPLAEVQVYIEELDDWADGIVLSTAAPGTEWAAEVEYVTPAGDMATISGVASEDLRLRATAAGELLAMEEAADEDTGLGGWTTVSEVVVDDAEVAAAQAMDEAEAREERKGNPNKRPAAALDDGERDEDVENALSFYSEGGAGGGMPVDNAGRIELESHAIAAGAKVGFKKRNKKVARVTRVKEEEE